MNQPINFQSKLNHFSEHWSPKVIAEMNDYQFICLLISFSRPFLAGGGVARDDSKLLRLFRPVGPYVQKC